MLLPKVEVKQLSKVYYRHVIEGMRGGCFDKNSLSPSDKLVLDNINSVLHSGEIVGIIGRNGAGKSTLLSILAGVSKQTHGEINIVGQITAVMTLGVGLREDLTGRENIYLDGEIQGRSRQEINEVIDEIIEFAELEDFIDRPLKVYSTGMKSRLAFSMLVTIKPEILIIDEALSAGDAFFAVKATKKIKEICEKGKIVIIVSHSMGTIESMCNRCLWLEEGRIIKDDKPGQVTQLYLQRIREEDQQIDLKKHQAKMSLTLEHANYKIMDVTMKLMGSDYQQNVFYTKDKMVITIEINRFYAEVGYIDFTIEKTDGLIISKEQCNLDDLDHSEGNSSFQIELSQDSLVLNKGYYQLKIELIERSKITNTFTRFFEVKNNCLNSGGTALLHYPAKIMLLNEE